MSTLQDLLRRLQQQYDDNDDDIVIIADNSNGTIPQSDENDDVVLIDDSNGAIRGDIPLEEPVCEESETPHPMDYDSDIELLEFCCHICDEMFANRPELQNHVDNCNYNNV